MVNEQSSAPSGPSEHRSGPPMGRPSGPGGPGGPRKRRYVPHRKVCIFCVDKVKSIDYKEPPRLRRFISDRGKIESRRKTGTCARHQRQLTEAIKRARHLALIPFTAEHIRQTGVFVPRQ